MPLSQVLAYNTDHLVEAAAHWQALADHREETFAGVRNDALTLPLEGATADALHQRTLGDYDTAMESAGNLRQASMIAKDGASTLDQMHSRVLYTLEDAQADGFAPTEALQFVDTRPSANAAELAQRQAQAQAYSGQLQAQVATLYTHDTEVGTDMANATAGEGKIMFTDYTTGDGRKIPSPPHKPSVIDQSQSLPVPDGRHPCSAGDIADDAGKVVLGGVGIGGALAAGVPTGPPGWAGAITAIGGGAIAIREGFKDLEQCEP